MCRALMPPASFRGFPESYPVPLLLVCTHTDGHNGSGNIHVHIIINSLRKLDIEPQSYTTRSIDCKAGYKHHLTKDYLKYLQQELMNLCQRENLYQVDLLSPAQHKITEAEYWLQKRGQKELEDINEQIIADGMNTGTSGGTTCGSHSESASGRTNLSPRSPREPYQNP